MPNISTTEIPNVHSIPQEDSVDNSIPFDIQPLQQVEGDNIYQRIENVIPSSQTLWIPNTALLVYWIKINRLPPNMKDIAYSTGSSKLTPEKAEKQLRDADYILCQQGDWWDKRLRDEGYDCYLIDESKRLLLYSKQ